MNKFGVILLVDLVSMLSAVYLIGSENLIVRLAAAPAVMIAIFCTVWLVQMMGKRPNEIERRLIEEAEKKEAAQKEKPAEKV